MSDMPITRCACIDVGSGALTMLIVETDGQKIRVLDTLRKVTTLGRDCYAAGTIRHETVREVCETLKGFGQLLSEYGIEDVRVVATSAIREASNRELVIDQIHLSTGFEVEVLSNAEERYLTYQGLENGLPGYLKMRREGMLIVDVGYGSTEVTEIRGGRMIMSLNVKLGVLRLWELISSLAAENPRYPDILEELILSSLGHLRGMVRLKDITHCVVLSGEVDQLTRLAGGVVTRKRFNQLYEKVRGMTTAQLQREYGIQPERAEILLPTLMVIRAFQDMTGAESLHLIDVSLRHGVAVDLCVRHGGVRLSEGGEEDILSVARALGDREKYDDRHAQDVEEKSCQLFDALIPLHGMGRRERLLLRIAAILHDAGKRLSTVRHNEQSAALIAASPIIGLSDGELAVITFVVYHHSSHVFPGGSPVAELPLDRRLTALKLLALIKLADSMDKGYRQKLSIEQIELTADILRIDVRAREDALLERWIFGQNASAFKDVFGISPQLRIRS